MLQVCPSGMYKKRIDSKTYLDNIYWAVLRICKPHPPLVLSLWPSKRKLGESKSKYARLALQNGCGSASFHRMLRAGKWHSRA